MRIALGQLTTGEDPKDNLRLVRDAAREAAGQDASVLVLPEATMVCFGVPLGPIAEPLDGPWASAVAEIAEEFGLLVIAGMFTPADTDRVHNTTLITGRGMHRGYDKIHLYDAFGFAESKTVAPGSHPVTVELDGVTLGIATCYDIRFPELFRILADRGAQAILLGASWGDGEGKLEQWELLVRARALDCTSWVLAADQASPAASGIEFDQKVPRGVGHSTVADPLGRIAAQAGEKPTVLVAEIDPKLADKTREIIPVLANRQF